MTISLKENSVYYTYDRNNLPESQHVLWEVKLKLNTCILQYIFNAISLVDGWMNKLRYVIIFTYNR